MRKTDIIIVAFSIAGTALLGVLSHFAAPISADISQIPALEGKTVEVECIVCGMAPLDSGGAIISARDLKNASRRCSIFLESCGSDFDMGDIICAKGKVVKYKGAFEIYSLDEKSVQMIRESGSAFASIWVWELAEDPGKYLGMTVNASGIAKNCGTYSFKLESGGCSISVKLAETGHMPTDGDEISVHGEVLFDKTSFRYYLGVSSAVMD